MPASGSLIRFNSTLLKPVRESRDSSGESAPADANDWLFLNLPAVASRKLPSRGQVSVEGTFNGHKFQATLEPDGAGGHWMKVDRKLREAAKAKAGDDVEMEIAPLPPEREPEPVVPADVEKMLAAAPAKVREVWADITPIARRDWIQWITSGKKAETRIKRIDTACDMLAKGKRRPCCFDRSGGMYSSGGGKGMRCPVADEGA